MTPHESPASIADSAERIGKKTYKEKKGGGVGCRGWDEQPKYDGSFCSVKATEGLFVGACAGFKRFKSSEAPKKLQRQQRRLRPGLRFIICSCEHIRGMLMEITSINTSLNVQKVRASLRLCQAAVEECCASSSYSPFFFRLLFTL